MENTLPHPPRLPIIGNLLDVTSHNPLQNIEKVIAKYGPIIELKFFNRTVIILSGFEYVKEICDETRFDKNLSRPLLEVRDFAGDGLFTAWTNEENWQKAHNILLPGLGQRAMKGYFPMMLDALEHLLAKWHNIPENAFFNLTDDMTRLTFDTIGLCGFDYRFHSFANEKPHPFITAMVNALEDAMHRITMLSFQKKIRYFKNKHYQKSVQYMNGVVDTLIKERKQNPEKYTSKADFLSLMMNATDKASGEKLSDINIRYQILTFLIAGHETTSGLLSFAFYLLATHPQVLEKAYQEVEEVLGNDLSLKPTYQQIQSLRYIPQILLETLRLYPTAPGFGVYATKDTFITPKHPIKKRQPIIVVASCLHRDKTVWGENANDFNPEHFTPEAIAQRDPDAYKPFGNGQRACIGRQFAMLEATLAVAMILQRYKVVLKDNYQLRIKETLTIKPDDLWVRLEKRVHTTRKLPQNLAQNTPKNTLPQNPNSTLHLHLLYGSNMGASEDFALHIAQFADNNAIPFTLESLDQFAQSMQWNPAHTYLIITSTYNGTPPDNARLFYEKLNEFNSPQQDLSALQFAIFGCGNTQWKTFQAFPRWIDEKLQSLGAKNIIARGEADASEDFDGVFQTWFERLVQWQNEQQNTQFSTQKHIRVEKKGKADSHYQNPTEQLYAQATAWEIVQNNELQSPTSPRSTREIIIELPTSIDKYTTGGHVAIIPQNNPIIVKALCEYFQLDPQEIVQIKPYFIETPLTVSDLFSYAIEIQQPAQNAQITTLMEYTQCPHTKAQLQRIQQQPHKPPLIALLFQWKALEVSFEQYLALTVALKPRYFSISSSYKASPRQIRLTVGIKNEPHWSGEGLFQGVCSTYLAQKNANETIRAFLPPIQSNFVIPDDPQQEIIMIAAGTGIAPFIAFLEERAFLKQKNGIIGTNTLYFGCRNHTEDLLYATRLAQWQQEGLLNTYFAFSRPMGDIKSYVQQEIEKNGLQILQQIKDGAIVYLCGDATGMAEGVRQTLVGLYEKNAQTSPEEAENWLQNLIDKGQYRTDVWG